MDFKNGQVVVVMDGVCRYGLGCSEIQSRIPMLKLKIPGKVFLKSESRTSVTFKLKILTLAIYKWQRLGLSKSAAIKNFENTLYFSQFFHNYNLNVTEIRDSDFKNSFLGIFNFTVGILIILLKKFRIKKF